MKTFMLSIITGIIIGAAGLYLTLDWQEEKLIYKLSEPAQFGEITYQNMQISNNGWNPATNVIIYLSHPSIKQGKIGEDWGRGRLGTLLTMLNNSIAVADRMEPTIQESKGEISQYSQQRPLKCPQLKLKS